MKSWNAFWRRDASVPQRPRNSFRGVSTRASICLFLLLGLLQGKAEWPQPPKPGAELPPASLDVESASLEELFLAIQVYGTTPQKVADKRASKKAFFAHESDALAYLMEQIHIENLWIRITAFELVRILPEEEAVPVLLEALESDHEIHKKYALFFLGFFDRPESPPDLTAYLSEDKLQGGAIRTLGKWRTASAVPILLPYLQHEKERIRIMTANALRDIGDPAASNALLSATEDEFFTVRKTAERALEQMKKPVEEDSNPPDA